MISLKLRAFAYKQDQSCWYCLVLAGETMHDSHPHRECNHQHGSCCMPTTSHYCSSVYRTLFSSLEITIACLIPLIALDFYLE